jgi:hypothetical protein
MNWYVLEWNGLDNGIDLYEFESAKEDVAEVWDEVTEGLHQYSSILVMDRSRLENLFAAVDSMKQVMKTKHQKRRQSRGRRI